MVDVAAAVRRGRTAARAIFTDTCVIERRSGRALNEDTLEYVDTWAPVYEGRCRVQTRAIQPASEPIGGRDFTVTDAVVQLPVLDVLFVDDDRVTITGAPFDPDLVGVVLSVTSREVKTHATMRRLHVSEVT